MSNKIIDGLKEVLSYVRGDCRHEFTYWDRNTNGRGWSRTCTKCKIVETTFEETDEVRAQT